MPTAPPSAIASTDPCTGAVVRAFTPHSDAEVEERVARAYEAAREWRKTSFAHRKVLLLRAADLLVVRKEELAGGMTLEMGKLLGAARAEVEKCAATCRHFAQAAEGYLRSEEFATDATRSYTRCDPLGVVLAVMPWNFPLWQVVRFAAPALMAGNVGLLKHASNVPQCALALEKLFADAGFLPGCFQALLIPASRVEALVADSRIAACTLTGSERAGRSLALACGRALKKVVLELGGSDPFLVLPSADLDPAVDAAVSARVQNAGQSCIASKRFLIHTDVWEAFVPRFVKRLAALRVGDPRDPGTELGPLVSALARKELHAQVQASVRAGAQLLCGGHPVERAGFFYEATALAHAPEGSPARDEELFGPVASLLRVRSLDEAISVANETRFGLGACAFTRELGEQERLAVELDAGAVFFNGVVKSDARLPFGGVKASGFGRELAREGIREFVNVKTVWAA